MKSRSIFTALAVVLLLSCSKEQSTADLNKGDLKSSTPLTSFSGYEIWSAPWAIQNEVFNVSPDPDPAWQTLNENIYYTGYALKEMILSGTFPSLVQDIKQNLDQDSELTIPTFFAQYPNYEAYATSVLMNTFGVDFADILNHPINSGGVNYSVAILMPENTINGADDTPIIAMAIELQGPNHDEIEDYGEDFIPAFYYEDEGYSETAVGYDDQKDYKKADFGITAVIVVTSAAVIGSGLNWALGLKVFDVDPNSIIGTPGANNNPNPGGPTCEVSYTLSCTQMTCTQRFQKWGKSRVRMGYDVDHPLDPSIDFGSGQKYRIGNMKKSEVTKTFNNPFSLNGYDMFATAPQRDQDPNGFYFLVMTYEYDWYATQKGYRIELPGIGSGINVAITGRMKKAHEFYQRMWVPGFDWCAFDESTYTSSGTATLKAL